MTLPDERTRSIIKTRQLLRDLIDPKKSPKVPKTVRQKALSCLRHYPSLVDLTDPSNSIKPLTDKEFDEILATVG